MPKVEDNDHPRAFGSVPDLMLETVVKGKHLANLPPVDSLGPTRVGHADGGVTVRDRNSEMGADTRIGRPGVWPYVGAREQHANFSVAPPAQMFCAKKGGGQRGENGPVCTEEIPTHV